MSSKRLIRISSYGNSPTAIVSFNYWRQRLRIYVLSSCDGLNFLAECIRFTGPDTYDYTNELKEFEIRTNAFQQCIKPHGALISPDIICGK